MGEGTTTHEAELKNGCLGSSDMQRARYNYGTLFCRVSTIKKGEKRTKEKLIHISYPFQEPSLPPPIKLSN